jgi:hypothetical protein
VLRWMDLSSSFRIFNVEVRFAAIRCSESQRLEVSSHFERSSALDGPWFQVSNRFSWCGPTTGK